MGKKNDGTKTCKACGITKPIERFYTNGKSWRAVCIKCMAESRKESGNGNSGNTATPITNAVPTREKVVGEAGNPLPHMVKVVQQGGKTEEYDDSKIVTIELHVLPKEFIIIGDMVDEIADCDTCGRFNVLQNVYARHRRITCCNDCCLSLETGRMLIAFKGYKLVATYPIIEKEIRS